MGGEQHPQPLSAPAVTSMLLLQPAALNLSSLVTQDRAEMRVLGLIFKIPIPLVDILALILPFMGWSLMNNLRSP